MDSLTSPHTPMRSDASRVPEGSGAECHLRPFITDDGVNRRLHFGALDVQSDMRIDDPIALQMAYTRKMMAFLLFQPYPRQVVIVGLGGGSLTKFCHRQLRTTRITTVEISAEVIDLAQRFGLPASDTRMRIVHADAVEHFEATREWADVVMLDGCDEGGLAPAFCSEMFYRRVRMRLRPCGLLVVNLCGSESLMQTHERLITEAFNGQVIVQSIRNETNRIAFAFTDPWRKPDWSAMRVHAQQLARQHQLDFPGFARLLQQSYLKRTKRNAR